jgi:hypothetical protein
VLKLAVTKVCGVCVAFPGAVTALLRAKYNVDSIAADTRRKAHNQADLEKKARGHLKKGIKFNKVTPIFRPFHRHKHLQILNVTSYPFASAQNMEEPLATSKTDLEDELALLGNAKMACYAYLKRQFSAREARAALDKFFYPQIGATFRDKSGKKLKLTPSNGEDKHQYLKELVLRMMTADGRREHNVELAPVVSGLVRLNPVINLASTDPLSTRAKEQQDLAIGKKVTQTDDPWLLALEREYVDKLCFLDDISLRHKLYRICRIAFWPSTKRRYASWEGTMEPVHVHNDGTIYRLDDDVIQLSNGKTTTKADKLIWYILAEYIDGDDSEPTRSDCVDRYAFHALEKQQAFEARSSAPTDPPRN